MPENTPSIAGLQDTDGFEKEIIRVASWNRRDFDLALAGLNSREKNAFRHSLTSSLTRDALASLGRLDILPLEIIHEILLDLDIQSLFIFRHVNLRARQIVTTIRPYQPLVDHAFQALWVILGTKISKHYTLQHLFGVLRTRDCSQCGSFSGFIFLPSFERCCFDCLEKSPRFDVLSLTEAVKRSGLSRKYLCRTVPTVKTLPGRYSVDQTERMKSISLVARQHIATISGSPSMRAPNLPSGSLSGGIISILRYMTSTSLPFFESKTGDLQYGICCIGCQVAIERDESRSEMENACSLRDMIYSNSGFLDHFHRCPEAQHLWMSSDKGRKAVKVPVVVKRGGFIFEWDSDTFVQKPFGKRKHKDLS